MTASSEPGWRTVELVVKRLEEILAPAKAMIRSPDRIRDTRTGHMREVDVSIRAQLGSVQVLIICECRNRDAVEDVSWIEQVRTKRDDLGAHGAIVVSTSGFSDPALAKARYYNVAVRTLDQLDASAVVASLGLPITLVIHRAELNNVRFYVDVSTPEGRAEVSALLGDPPLEERVFQGALAGALSLADIWHDFMARKGNSPFSDLSPGGDPVQLRARARFPGPDNYLTLVTASEGAVRVVAIEWDFAVWMEEQTVEPPLVYEYRAEDDRVLARMETYEVDVGSRRVLANVYRIPEAAVQVAADRVIWQIEE